MNTTVTSPAPETMAFAPTAGREVSHARTRRTFRLRHLRTGFGLSPSRVMQRVRLASRLKCTLRVLPRETSLPLPSLGPTTDKDSRGVPRGRANNTEPHGRHAATLPAVQLTSLGVGCTAGTEARAARRLPPMTIAAFTITSALSVRGRFRSVTKWYWRRVRLSRKSVTRSANDCACPMQSARPVESAPRPTSSGP